MFLQGDSGESRILTCDSTGAVATVLTDLRNIRLSAVSPGGDWYLGEWLPVRNLPRLLEVRFTEGGSAMIRSNKEAILQITSWNGWNLTSMLSQLGIAPVIALETPLRIGLPLGSYTLSLAGKQTSLTIQRDRITEVVIE